MVELRGASKSFGSTIALHPTDISFEPGKTTALIGPSGCGKSTLLRLLLGLTKPTTGQVLFDSKVVDEANLINIRRNAGYVIQDGGLFPHLTASQNVMLVASVMFSDEVGRELAAKAQGKNEEIQRAIAKTLNPRPHRLAGTPSSMPVDEVSSTGPENLERRFTYSQIQQRVHELAKLVRLPEELLLRYPAELSGGQRQRVGLMRALMLAPQVLLLDEPLAALDPMVRSALQEDLKRIFEELRATVILVTHDMGEAAYLADTIVLLREGKIVQSGKLEDFQKSPQEQFVTEFLNAQRQLVAL
jgi:osmoprotectant transport system ATP-binding protein